jgi:predicted O-linked N-acetylglucosamine transferase (SPINDLY family)
MTLLSRLFGKGPDRPLAAARTEGSPPAVATLVGQGDAAFRAGQFAVAREKFEQVLALDGDHGHAHFMRSAVALQQGDLAAAGGALQRAIELVPASAEYRFSLGNVLAAAGRTEESIAPYRAAVELNPAAAEWRVALAAALAECGRANEAVTAFRPGASASDAGAFYEMGSAFQARERPRAAAAAFAESARLEPSAAATHLMLAAARRDLGMVVEAEAPAREATTVAPDMPEGWFMLGSVLARQARHEEAVESFREAIALEPAYDAPWRSMLFSMNYSARWTPREIFDAHVESARRYPPAKRVAVAPSHRRPDHRVRVGYLSGDLSRHPVAYFLEPILTHHDRSGFEVFCYHTGAAEDGVSARLKTNAEHWRGVSKLSDDELEKTLRADELDLLVELSGYTDGHRLAVVARRVAPLQVSYLGYPNTTGLDAVDYRITDARADPPGEADTLHTETLVRLPETFLCYTPPFAGAFAPVPPSREQGAVTFGSFNNLAKLSRFNIALWARVLGAVPNSRLFVKAKGLQDPGLRAQLLGWFDTAGVDGDRILLAPPHDTIEEHFGSYARVDIALDTFPYHGTTTTMDALWMAVPVVTLAGDRHAARVSASILSGLGLDDLVAHTAEEYVEIARGLANDPARLEALRGSLRDRLAKSLMMDGTRFTRQLEQAYRGMWRAALARP